MNELGGVSECAGGQSVSEASGVMLTYPTCFDIVLQTLE